MRTIDLHSDPENEPTLSLYPEDDLSPVSPPPSPEHQGHKGGGQFISDYHHGMKNVLASNTYLEQVYHLQHGHFPSQMALKMMRAKRFRFLRKSLFAMEKVDAIVLGDDPLVSLCTAYSLAKQNNFKVLIVPTIERTPEGDTRETQISRIRDLYNEEMIGNFLREYFHFPDHADFSDYDAAIFTLTHACQALNEGQNRVMMAHNYSLMTDRTDAYQIPDEMDETLFHQMFYAFPHNDLPMTLFHNDWELIRRELLNHTLPAEAYESDNVITEIVTRLVYITSPLPLAMDTHIMCQHYRLASGLQSVSQVTQHTDFGYGQRYLDVMAGAGADLFAKEKVTAQDFIQKYSTM